MRQNNFHTFFKNSFIFCFGACEWIYFFYSLRFLDGLLSIYPGQNEYLAVLTFLCDLF